MKFYIIDASGFLFRAYHAFPELKDDKDMNINVVYGFFRILLKLFLDKPEYLVLTWDLPIPTERVKMDSTYKANRPSAPEDFKQQIPIVQEVVNALNIPNMGAPGYEADDVIASLAKEYGKNGDVDIYIISSDKDLKQLLDESVVIQDPMTTEITNVKTFTNEYGFEPKHMLDYLSLIGDAADNIKGVPGIGPKTAIKLIQEYKTIEAIYANIDKVTQLDKITEGVQKKLIAGEKSAYHSKLMIELMDIPDMDKVKLEQFKLNIDVARLKQVLVGDYNFESMTKLLDEIYKKINMPTQSSLFG